MIPADFRAKIHHFDQYFAPWAVAVDRFRAVVENLNGLDLRVHVQSPESSARASAQSRGDYDETIGTVAVIDVSGPMMKYASSLSGGSSTISIRRTIRNAANDTNVSAIVLRIDSPGGTVAGTQDLADEINAARKKKPVVAFIEDLCASAAMWIASQCQSVYANAATCLIGSIGTYAVLEDSSEAAEKLGVKVHVISSGGLKGAAIEGTKITDEMLADTQRIINSIQEQFTSAVAYGRKLGKDKVAELADGRVHPAAEAQAMGLIDGIKSFDAVIAELATPPSKPRAKKMENENKPAAATIQELKAACEGADSAFILGQLEVGATVTDALKAFVAHQKQAIAEANKKASEAESKAAAKGAGGLGTSPLVKKAGKKPAMEDEEGDDEEETDAKSEFDRLVRAKVEKGMDRMQAVGAVARSNPVLHRAYLIQSQPTSVARRDLQQKFESEDEIARNK